MNELVNARSGERAFRWQLLTTVSALALLATVGMRDAKAADQDADRPTVWFELGGQLDHVAGHGDSFPVGFLAANSSSPVLKPVSPLQAQNPPPFSFAEDGKISFQPEGSNWAFLAAANYGRSSNYKHVDHQTNGPDYNKYKSGVFVPPGVPPTIANFADTQVHSRESHAVIDFSVGRDVGLGLLGSDGSSTLNLGVRFAQFSSNATFDVRARPDLQIKNFPLPSVHVTIQLPHFHTYHATGQASRSFHGIGPSLSWNSSSPFAGNQQDGEVTFDWGANAALLFGRQKARAQHHESGHYISPFAHFHLSQYATAIYQHSGGHSNSRSVTVPNVGGFAGASIRYSNVKLSLGYRADLFFGAIDGGIDTRKEQTLGFFGPFATVSIGIGG